MPAGIKPPHCVGKKGRSGRKTKAEEFEAMKEKIKQEALIELANKRVFKHLNADLNFVQTKEMALPITLKGISEKVDITTKGKSLNYNDDQRRKIAERIINRKPAIGATSEKPSD